MWRVFGIRSSEERVETGEDAETGGYDFELEFLVFAVVDFLFMLDSGHTH